MTTAVQRTTLMLALSATLGSVPGAGSAVESEERTPNRLVHESSPYLSLHAHNPVDWYPWGSEALDRARKEQKPIFLSVGYSTCYWCHVMEREVFEDPELAALMNEYFVNVKVDREERPEIDEIYMTATQILTRSGGWPNSVFLTPELEPFFAGTYFPPEDRAGRPGFRRVLEALNRAWTDDRARVRSDAARVAAAVRSALATRHEKATELPSRAAAEVAVEQLGAAFDETHGGFGSAPKFPSPASLSLLWQQAVAGDAAAERMVIETLRKMGRGAIYDQLDGGFHRYTLDAAWRIPHFEKMLYDNALVGELLAVVAAASRDPELERLARGTLDFVLEWMRLSNGAFKSAIDAETDAVEGAYYIWTREEFAAAVGEEGYSLLAPLFGIDGEPNFEERAYTLYPTRSIEEWAAERGMTPEALASQLEPHLEALRDVRGRRPFPLVDDKVLVDWNGMMIAALARAGAHLESERYLRAAERAADFVLGLRDERGVLQHTWRNGEAKIPAFLDDYAFLVRGLLTLHEATGAQRWLDEAIGLTEQLEERLRAPVGGYYMSEARDDLLLQVVSAVDSSTPSGNGVALENLIDLARRTGRAVYSERAEAALRVFSGDLQTHPRAVTTVAAAVLRGVPTEPRAIEPTPPTIGALARKVVRLDAIFEGGSSGAWRPFRVDLEVQDGWHVNANPASLDFLIPTQVAGEVRGLDYPAGESFRFEFAPEAISVYSGRTELRGEVLVETPKVSVTYQACDDRRCLPPVTESLTIR